MKRILLVLALVLLQGLDCAAGPKLFFSDLTDGVISGGHWAGAREGKGAAVSIWGRNLGSSRDTSKVSVCGVTLDAESDFAEWGATTEPIVPLEMQRITFFLNESMQTGPGTIRVTTEDGDSNEIPFYCRDAGNIYFLDSTAGNDDYNGQYPTPQTGENGPKRSTAWARGNLDAGDVVYLRGGTYKDHDVGAMYHYGGLFSFGRDDGVPNHHNGDEDQSIAVAAYPGDNVRLEATEACGAGTCLNRCICMFYSGTQLDYWTFSKLTMIGAESAIQLGGTGYANGGTKHIRLVNIDGTTIYDPQIGNGCIFSLYGSAKNMEDFKILGCYLHDQLANSRGQIWEDVDHEERAYQVYVGGYGSIKNMELGWNDMGWGSMGRGVQIYGHLPEDAIETLIVHNNWFHHNRRQAFILGGGDGGEEYAFVKSAYFYNNILSHSGWPVDESWCTFVIGGVSWGRHGGDFHIYNNLIDGRSLAYPPINLTGFIDSLDLKNNMILAQPNQWGYYTYHPDSPPQNITAGNNLYFGAGPGHVPAWDPSSSGDEDPMLVKQDAQTWGDCLLQSNSPAIDSGASLSSNMVADDFLGAHRPLDGDDSGTAQMDIGPFEFGRDQPQDSPDAPSNDDGSGGDSSDGSGGCFIETLKDFYGLSGTL